MRGKLLLGSILSLFGLVLLTGCSRSASSPTGQGEVRLMLVDAPASFNQVNLMITKVEVHAKGSDSSNGWHQLNNAMTECDLLSLAGGASSTIGDKHLPVGQYDQIRVSFGEGSNVLIDSVKHTLEIAGASGSPVDYAFSIGEGRLCALTLGFIAAPSVNQSGNGRYQLRPQLAVIANDGSGTISGTISPASVRATVTATAPDADTIRIASDSTDGSFMLVALPTGSYNLKIEPASQDYLRTTVTGIQVSAQKNKSIGIISLTERP